MGTIQSKAKHYYHNQKRKKMSKNIPSSRKNYKKSYFEKYPPNPNAVKVRHYRNGIEVFDVKVHYSYIYKGVPGGLYVN